MEENLHCYTFELHKFSKGLLDASLDATYVIHLRNNGRYESILKEVTDYKPTRLVYIVLNDGYKKCKKVFPQEGKQSPTYDIADANLQIYKHAEQMKYRNILVLEDDCIFSPDIRKDAVVKDVTTFFLDHSSVSFTYRLGCLPILLNPFLRHASYGFYLGLHAYVISQEARRLILHRDPSTILDMEEFINFYTSQYTYYKPLAYQLYPETESQKVWGNNIQALPSSISNYIPYMGSSMIKSLNLDTSIYPGYAIMYTIAKILYSLLILIVLFLVYKGVQWIPFIFKLVRKQNRRRK
jgi:hypothetical protein